MKIQLLSDLHLESESFEPVPAPGAELLVLGGDIDATWTAYERFAGWPVPVLVVAGNHEFDGRELDQAWPALAETCERHGLKLLERETLVVDAADGRRIRFAGTVRWNDFDLFGAAERERSQRAAAYFMRLMDARRGGQPFDVQAVRAEALACRAWLEAVLAEPARGRWDASVVVTHFAPSLKSADPRYGRQPATASFCNADDDLITRADLWLHGHLHCRHDYRVERAGARATRVVCQARGLAKKGEHEGLDPFKLIEI
ncbi:phosphoesterase [Rubrivivax gelatinosus]|uniref:Phosphoesterase n=1 Tax=Rubrivivax gelatinosus TaxID=28068 RepID=A0ABS1DS79_RUBGE|nr:metallophosphoesterase [Rubrivivax gelatinosus]MBK1612679.1 phosphoesterase [Rubrivivax gelatinosus]MBK1712343.1 phosphoesterase [Rubrivivax gelatinosus]